MSAEPPAAGGDRDRSPVATGQASPGVRPTRDDASSMASAMASTRLRGIPVVVEDAARDYVPRRAEADVLAARGLPTSRPDDWHERAIGRLGELVESRRGLAVFLDSCTHCGACTDKCHYFLGTGDPKNMPVARQDLLRSVYRRHFTWTGRWMPWLVGARDLDEAMLDDWYRYFHQCSECRRCTVFCPQGIDTSEITMAGRDILAHVGEAAHYPAEIVVKATRLGNNLGMKRPALAATLESLEEDLLDETGVAVAIPLDREDSELLLVAPSADFFAEPHVDGLLGYAKVLHAAGVRWTLSSLASEAANFALFDSDEAGMRTLAGQIVEAARSLGVRRIAIGECGHAWRMADSIQSALTGDALVIEHICEVTHALWRAGRVQLDPAANAGVVPTFHDSCNVSRGAAMGTTTDGAYRIPRELLAASCPSVIEMAASTTREQTFCCGGGGGLLTDELMDLRIAGSRPRATALADVVATHGVTHLVAICAICKTQFSATLPAHDLGDIEVASLHQLVGNAVVL